MNRIESNIQDIFTKLGCDESLISSLQREIFGKPEDSGSLTRCFSYAQSMIRKSEPSLVQQFVETKAERFSADWGHIRYETTRSDSDRILAMYRILVNMSEWNGHTGYFNKQLIILSAKMNEMSENRPSITFSDIRRMEQRTISDPEKAHELFGELLDFCSEITVTYVRKPQFI